MKLYEFIEKCIKEKTGKSIEVTTLSADWLTYNYSELGICSPLLTENNIVYGYSYKDTNRYISILFENLFFSDSEINPNLIKFEVIDTVLPSFNIKFPDFQAQQRAMIEANNMVVDHNNKIIMTRQKFLRLHKTLNINGFFNLIFKSPDEYFVNTNNDISITVNNLN